MSQKYYSRDNQKIKGKPVNLFLNPQLRTIRVAKTIYDIHVNEKKYLKDIAKQLGLSYSHTQKLYNWYSNYMEEVKI